MGKAIFLLDNQADAAAITSSSTAGATMAAGNLLNEQRSKVWRSAAGTTSYVDLTLGQTYGSNYAALIDVNLSTTGTIRVQSWRDALGGAQPWIDVTVTPTLYINQDLLAAYFGNGPFGVGPFGTNGSVIQNSGRNITLIPFPSISLDQYFRVTFTDINSTYQQCGRVFLGKGVEFPYNISHGWSGKRVERTVRRESLGGQAYRQMRDSRLQLDGNFELLTDAERTDMFIRMQEFGESKSFVFSVYPEATNRGLTTTLYGRFINSVLTNTRFGHNALNFSVLEEL